MLFAVPLQQWFGRLGEVLDDRWNHCSIPKRAQPSLSPNRELRVFRPSPYLCNEYREFLPPSIERLGPEVNISPLSSSEVKNVWIPTTISLIWHGAKHKALPLHTGPPKVSAWTHLQWHERCYSRRSTMTTFRCVSTGQTTLICCFILQWIEPLLWNLPHAMRCHTLRLDKTRNQEEGWQTIRALCQGGTQEHMSHVICIVCRVTEAGVSGCP
jgi:hypothetical protein